MGRVEGKVALVTGAARGQGRSHAVRLAEEGASIVGLDIVSKVDTAVYELSTPEDLDETGRLVEAAGGRVLLVRADVRDQAALDAAVGKAIAEFGKLDVVVANAGIFSVGTCWELSEKQWQEMLDVNLTGVWHTVKAAVPTMIEAAEGGSIIMTSSTAGLKRLPFSSHYAAAKHGVVGLMRTLAGEVAEYGIRVNTVHPTTVSTPMIMNEPTYGLFRPDLEHPTVEDATPVMASVNLFPVPWVEARDISNAVLWLASDESRYVTGTTLCVDAGFMVK